MADPEGTCGLYRPASNYATDCDCVNPFGNILGVILGRAVAVVGVLVGVLVVATPAIPNPGSRPSGTAPPPPSPPSAGLPPGGPERITIPVIGVRAAVRGVVSTHEQGLWVIVPPMATNADLRHVYWWREHAAPAAPSKGTAYIYGHACTHYSLCAFNHLPELAPGDLVRVTTTRGTLTYRVTAPPVRLAKTSAGIGASSIYDYSVVNRLVLVTCGYASNGSSPWNWVVITQLVAATPAP